MKKVFLFKKINLNSGNFFDFFYSRKFLYTDKTHILRILVDIPLEGPKRINFNGVQKITRLKKMKKVFLFKKINLNSGNFFDFFYSRKFLYTDKTHIVITPRS